MLTTERLILRNWRDGDRIPFSRLCADRRVVGDFPGVMTPSESGALMEQFMALWAEHGFSYGAIERRADGEFLGMAGIARCDFDDPFHEIGWALLPEHWDQGYATEAALGWLAHGFDTLGLPEVVAYTDAGNPRSVALMRRIGMRRDETRGFGAQFRPENQILFVRTRTDWQGRRP